MDHLDKHVYVKMFGYKSVADYYSNVDIDKNIKGIQIPTFAFESIDDPFANQQLCPINEIIAQGSHVFVASSVCGGHASHITGGLMPKTFVH